ncbi:MAG: sulfatase-like hydrolase/transferase [Pirellulaceae bacterium]|nr:sulfatase-like hydrolase/transferase [Pirellulaceae bacterium]
MSQPSSQRTVLESIVHLLLDCRSRVGRGGGLASVCWLVLLGQTLVASDLPANPIASAKTATADRPGSDRPNIVFAFADDWGRLAGAYAALDQTPGLNSVVQTPNIDRIAGDGVLFRHAFVSAPSCTPCRSSLLSGQHFWRTGRGAILQGAVWDPTIPAFPLLLKDSGYHIGKTFKVWSPGVPVDAPFGGQAHSYEKAGRRFNQFSQQVTRMVADGQEVPAAKETLYDEVRGNFRQMIAECPEGQPFFYWFGPTNVHRTWVKGSGQKLWDIDPATLQGKLPPFLPDVAEVREDMADYLGEIAAFDAAIGVLMEELERTGQAENSLWVISGDHGPPGFPQGKCNLYDFGSAVPLVIAGPGVVGGRVVDDFTTLPDLAPTFLEAAGVTVPEVMTARSLWPTLGSEQVGQVDKQRTLAFVGRERHVEMARAGNLPYPQRAIRTAQHAYIINFEPDRYPLGDPYHLDSDREPDFAELEQSTFVTLPDEDAGPTKAWLVTNRKDPRWQPYFQRAYGKRPGEELYDLQRDPHQMQNLAADPAYTTIRASLRQRLLAELTETSDPRVTGDGRYFEEPPLAGPLPDDVPQPNRQRRPPPSPTTGRVPTSTISNTAATETQPPNVVVIFCDDLGYGDLGCFGHPTIRTPQLDRLAAEGQKWTSFYVADPVCTPSRAGLLTGRYPIRNGMTSAPQAVLFPNSQGGLPAAEVTLAELLKQRDYATGCFGKWHLGHLPQFLPTTQGFDTYFGIPYSNDMDATPDAREYHRRSRGEANFQPPTEWFNVPLMRDTDIIERPADQRTITQRYTDEAIAFIRQHKAEPFFVYLAHNMPHIPLLASDDFQGRSPRGLYGDVVEELDFQVGRLVQTLREEGLAEKTLVVFTSDNGPWLSFQLQGGSAGPLRAGKGTTFEGGQRVPTVFWWPGTIPAGTTVTDMGSTLDLMATVATLTGTTVPADRTLDSYDLTAALTGTGMSPRQEFFYWTRAKLHAVRVGPYKLHVHQRQPLNYGQSRDLETPELYHVEHDVSEQFDIAAEHPQVVAQLLERLQAHQASIEPVPDQLANRQEP